MKERYDEVRGRRLDRAVSAGRRWQGLLERRAETVRLLQKGGPQLADSRPRVERFLVREESKRLAYARAGVTEGYFAERMIGPTLDLDDTPPDDAGRQAGLPVGRIVELDDQGAPRDGFATGFLVSPGLVITNHHVFATASECRDCGIQFGYEKTGGGLASGTTFRFDTDLFFYSNEQLDFALVGVAPAPVFGRAALQSFNCLGLIPATGKILVGQPVSIIQYPAGGPKKYGIRDNELLIAPSDADLFLQYTTDTLPGSSGSPAFNKDWEVVGLHHSGIPEMKDGQILTIRNTPWTKGMDDSEIHWIANEGVRVSCICNHLAGAQVKPEHRAALENLVNTFREDFSRLPAVQSRAEAMGMDTTNPVSGGAVSITVNGSAVFNFGAIPAGLPKSEQGILPQPPVLKTAAVEKKLRFDPDYAHRPGYDENFLAVAVGLPGVTVQREKELLKNHGGNPLLLKYHHYSLVMNRARRLQMWSAVNVDYTPSKRRKTRDEFGTDTWVADPRIPGNTQIEDPELYAPAAKFDRGHIVRRDDTAWGDTAEEEILANSDSFHWTNCTPQHEQFNRAVFQYHGLWGELENYIQAQASNVGRRMSIFAGPVLDDEHDIDHDFGAGEVKIPRRFWKVLLVTENADSHPTLRAYGFILDQSRAIKKFGIEGIAERFSVGDFETYQVGLEEISTDTGVTFPRAVTDADAMSGLPDESRRIRLERLDNVRV